MKRGTELAAERGLNNVKFQVRCGVATYVWHFTCLGRAGEVRSGLLLLLLVRHAMALLWRARRPCALLNLCRPASVRSRWSAVSPLLVQVMDALKMDFPDNSFDLVWACESGEHMPDKKAYVDEMVSWHVVPGAQYSWGAMIAMQAEWRGAARNKCPVPPSTWQVRVLKPGGTLVIATWCQREETPETPFRCGP